MDMMMIHCTGCRAVLRVPSETSGRWARCPACKTKFRIPDHRELLDETVSSWLEQDEQTIARLDEQGALKKPIGDAGETVYAATVDPRAPAPKTPEVSLGARRPVPVEPTTESQPGTIIRQHSSKTYWGRKDAPKFGEKREPPPPPPPMERPAPVVPLVRSASGSGALPPATVDSAARAKLGDMPLTYPTSLQRDPVAPHLVVSATSHAGVTFAFDAIWLNHEGFRGSLPVRCAFCGRSKRDELIARPLVFVDRALADKATIEQAVMPLEHRNVGDRTPRQIAQAMLQVPHMPPPFQWPMPWFVSSRYAHMTLHCITRNRTDGGVTCEVLIPDAHTALHWLSNVNGMCGPEYELLEREVALLHGEAWRALSDHARNRIAYWCKLEPGEQFRLFVSDSDFGKRDEGMGGLVLTDQRLVFCKYHHRGQVALSDNALIRIKPHTGEPFVSLTLILGNDRHRMVKINENDLPGLIDMLGQSAASNGLRYEITESDTHKDDVPAPTA